MEGVAINPIDLLVEIIKEHSPKDIWQGSPLLGYRILGNTNRGEIGEEFVRRYLKVARIDVSVKGKRTALTDMLIGGHHFEVKTASLGANSTFQFNHIRMDRRYECLLCVGICPQEIVFNAWRKGEVAEEKAGRLVRMADGGPDEINTNAAESFFSRMRRAEIGHHHHVAGPYLIRFAQEAAFRENHRRDRNGDQVDRIVTLSMKHRPSVDFAGYWQRHARAA